MASGKKEITIEINQKTLKIALVIFGLIGLILLVYSTLFRQVTTVIKKANVEKIKEQLVAEFNGAYPESAPQKNDAKIVSIEMIAKSSEIQIMPGVNTKVWAYNNRVPGPIIRIRLGDTLKIDFTNKLPQETTIHFHGVRVPNAMDGVPGVTQPPIKPGEGFVYKFTPKDPGTYWFHPHIRSEEQIERGLFGVLIVEDESMNLYSQDAVWVVDDWRLQQDWQIDPRFMTPMDLMHDGRWGNIITVNAQLEYTQYVKPGDRIRLRLVNTSNGRIYKLNFGDLNATGIAVDGMYVRKPFNPNGFIFAPGNRLDVDITIPQNAKPGTEYIITDTFTRYTNRLGRLVVVDNTLNVKKLNKAHNRFIRYPQVQDVQITQTTPFALEKGFPVNPNVPIWQDANKIPYDKLYVLNARRVGMMRIQWTINGKAYPDYEPFTFTYGKLNKFRFRNDSARFHPMHLHGQFFKVIARNGKPVDEGFFRDTVVVGPRETVDLATVPLDKGRWANHCHILEHAESGMMTVVEVK